MTITNEHQLAFPNNNRRLCVTQHRGVIARLVKNLQVK